MRRKLLNEHAFDSSRIVRYPFKVFDVRWAYLANIRPLFSEPSPDLLQQRLEGNRFFITRIRRISESKVCHSTMPEWSVL